MKYLIALSWLYLLSAICLADNKQSGFLQRAFNNASPELQTLWLQAEQKHTLVNFFDYQLNRIRLRYWRDGEKTVWVLDEVGKEMPITFGVVVNQGQISSIEVLEYRESRGGEIQHAFFREQFDGAELHTVNNKRSLNQNIDGITGATLSVRAMKKVAKVALFLHELVTSSTLQ